jgi:nicotinamide mononucleotide transporter
VITPLEIGANVVTTVSILLAGRNSVHTWWTGILGCALFTVVFFESRLYADVALQLFFVAASALGWWQWLHGNRGASLAVSRAAPRILVLAVIVGIAAALGYGALLLRFTNAYAPFVDSAVLVFSVIAQVLLMQRRVENWPIWLLVNTIAVPLYASRGLYLTTALYAAYWLNAAISWRHWRRLAGDGDVAPTESEFA